MCQSCLREYALAPVTDQIREAFRLAELVYAGHCTGGGLHIILDDHNLEDTHLQFCNGLDLTPTERECLDVLWALSVPERNTVLSLFYQ